MKNTNKKTTRDSRAVFLFCFSLLALVIFPLSGSHAEAPAGKQQGEISMELNEEENLNTFSKVQDRTINKITKLYEDIELASEGTRKKTGNFDKLELKYLTVVYLYCTIKTGSCPFMLQTLLEADLINSAIDKNASCPNLRSFWKLWIEQDMEKRVGYNLGVGQFSKAQHFNKEIRPVFVQCKKTIAEILDKNSDASRLFISRYGESSPQKASAKKTMKLSKAIKKKIPNIFYKMNISS